MPNEKNRLTETAIYDKLFREISPVFLTVFAEKVLGLDIVEYSELKDKLQITRQKETDSLRKARDRKGDTFIFQLEIQKENEPDMPERMADYYILLHRLHRLPVRQYVLYIGPGKADMPDRLELPGFSFRYTLVSFSDLPHELFLDAEHTEIQMLALLGNLANADPYEVTERIVRAIDSQPTPVGEKYKRINQLRILSQLRNFTPQLEAAMLKAATFFKEERDPFYKRGQAKGIEKGAEQKSFEFVKNLIVKLGFSDEQAADVAEVSVDFVREVRSDLAKKKK